MKLAYDNITDILLQNIQDSNFTFKDELNNSLNKLIQNDLVLTPEGDNTPDVWKCSWYNVIDPEIIESNYGYSKGQAVWVNTEDLTDFIYKKWNEIENTIENNPGLSYQYKKIKDDKNKVFDFIKNVVTGKVSGSINREPLYYIGELSNDIQLRISQVDRNIYLPSDNRYWKDFFEYNISSENKTEISSFTDQVLSSDYLKHLKEYHLDCIDDVQMRNLKNNLEHNCVKCDLSANLSSINTQKFISHRSSSYSLNGFDFVKEFKLKKGAIGNTIKWYKIWNSGYLEQGGIICNGDGLYDINVMSNKFLQVKLPIKYDYIKQRLEKFYSIKKVDGTNLDDYDCLSPDNRYNVNITSFQNTGNVPYSTMNSDNCYESNEIACIKNETFLIRLTYGHTLYSFYTSGFVKTDNIESMKQIYF